MSTINITESRNVVLTQADPQSRAFMSELLPYIMRVVRRNPIGARLEVLDVGCGWGAGTELLASMFAGGFLGYTMAVDGYDITADYQQWIMAMCPHVRQHIVQPSEPWPSMADKQYDIVIASHVIEHVDRPDSFLSALRGIARRAVIVYAPFEEDPENLIPGHIHSFNHSSVHSLHPRYVDADGSMVYDFDIVRSAGWPAGMCWVAEFEPHPYIQ